MPKLTALSTIVRKEQAMDVFLLTITANLSIRDACDQVGIGYSTYRKYIGQMEDAISAINAVDAESEKNELALLATMRERGTEILMKDLLKADTFPSDRLAILNYMNTRIEYLRSKYQNSNDEETRKLLQGPTLVEQESRFAPGTTPTLEATPLPDGSINLRATMPLVIDQ